MNRDLHNHNPEPKDNEYDNDKIEYRSRNERNKKPWYNQGWVWLIVAVIGIGVVYFGFSALTQETANINESIKEQTALMKEQNQILSLLKGGLEEIAAAIKDAVIAIKDMIYNLFI
jgi:hypothetical protein